MSDGSGSDPDREDPVPGEETEHVGEQYREPEEPTFGVEPTVPEPPDPEAADPELRASFWGLVLVFNLAILGVSVGALFAVVRGDYALGGQLFLGGAVLFAYGLYRYRRVRRTIDDRND